MMKQFWIMVKQFLLYLLLDQGLLLMAVVLWSLPTDVHADKRDGFSIVGVWMLKSETAPDGKVTPSIYTQYTRCKIYDADSTYYTVQLHAVGDDMMILAHEMGRYRLNDSIYMERNRVMPFTVIDDTTFITEFEGYKETMVRSTTMTEERKTHKLSEYVGKGRWTFVDFWASWCGPCRREMPNVVAAYEKFHGKGLDIVGVSLDGQRAPWVEAIEKLKMPWVHLSDLKGKESLVEMVYNVNAIPDNLLIDPKGKIVARELYEEDLHAKLAEIFESK